MESQLLDYKLLIERKKTKAAQKEEQLATRKAELEQKIKTQGEEKLRLKREEDSVADELAQVTRSVNATNDKRKDLARKRDGIMGTKREHLRELLEKDLHRLKLTLQAQLAEKERIQRQFILD